MELITFKLPKSTDKAIIAPIGDIQWSGHKGPTAKDSLKRHIDRCMKMGAWFVGTGDYIDFMSPSGRRKLNAIGLYDTQAQVIQEAAAKLTMEVYEEFFKGTEGRWIGKVSGHHYFEMEDWHSDVLLADLLKTTFLGTAAMVKIPSLDFTMRIHHGVGGTGVLPAASLNKLYHEAAGWGERCDVVMMGHCTKLNVSRLARPYVEWGKRKSEHKLQHRDIHLLTCGGFCASNIVGSCTLCGIPRGTYAEQAMYTPAPLTSGWITIDLNEEVERVRVTI